MNIQSFFKSFFGKKTFSINFSKKKFSHAFTYSIKSIIKYIYYYIWYSIRAIFQIYSSNYQALNIQPLAKSVASATPIRRDGSCFSPRW